MIEHRTLIIHVCIFEKMLQVSTQTKIARWKKKDTN